MNVDCEKEDVVGKRTRGYERADVRPLGGTKDTRDNRTIGRKKKEKEKVRKRKEYHGDNRKRIEATYEVYCLSSLSLK